MSAPDKCLKCGADIIFTRCPGGNPWYSCGTAGQFQSVTCAAREPLAAALRDALARVKRLEESGDKLQRIVGQKGDPQLWVDESECDAAVDGWAKAKEAKP